MRVFDLFRNKQNRLKRELEGVVGDALSGAHPTLEALRQQLERNTIEWFLLSDQWPYKVGRSVVEQPPKGTALLNAGYRSNLTLPTLPTFDIRRGILRTMTTDTQIEVSVHVLEGNLNRVCFRTTDTSSFPESIRGWQYTPPSSSADSTIPVFVEPDYSVLQHPFERWLMGNIRERPNGSPGFPLDSPDYPLIFGYFRHVFSRIDFGDISFETSGQCFIVEHDGIKYWSFADDCTGDQYCFKNGEDQVWQLCHDPTEVKECGPFEAFLERLVDAGKDKKHEMRPNALADGNG